jgi:uncharacterized membrane-anchored protein
MAATMKIGNVNILDLQNATEESVASVHSIGNVNLIFHNRKTAGLIMHIRMGNINGMVEIPENVSVIQRQGQSTLNRGFFKSLNSPTVLVVMGQVIVETDVLAGDINDNFKGMVVLGQILYPESLAGIIEGHTLKLLGDGSAYTSLVTTVMGDLELTPSYLNGLADGAELAVLGNLYIKKVVDNDQLRKKLSRLYALGTIVYHDENAAAIRAVLVKNPGHMDTIPTGFELLDRPLNLDAEMVSILPSKKLYCKERVVISEDVTPQVLDGALESITCKQLLIAPAGLKASLAVKTNLFDTKAIFYSGKLWLVEDSLELTAARMDTINDPVTLVVTGEVSIDADVPVEKLEKKILKLHNFGSITGSAAQIAALESRLGMHEGQLAETSNKDEGEDEPESGEIGNVNYLAL